MQLLKVKTGLHHVVKNSGWFGLKKQLTMLVGPPGSGKTTILRALHAINPLPAQNIGNPFSDYPQYFYTRGFRRKVDFAKKTAAIGVYVCSDDLRAKLAKIDPALYETDRIEVGRRLDLSRWITFVEISSSSRWSELRDDFIKINKHIIAFPAAAGFSEQSAKINALNSTDRVKGETMELLGEWLEKCASLVGGSIPDVFERFRFVVYRAKRFQRAKKIVAEHLPYFIYCSGDFLLNSQSQLSALDQATESVTQAFIDSPDYCLKQLLGKDDTPKVDRHKLNDLFAKLNKQIKSIHPESSHTIDGDVTNNDILVLYRVNNVGERFPVDQGDTIFQWLTGLALLLLCCPTTAAGKPVLLLDEPDKIMHDAQKKMLRRAIDHLAQNYQIVMATKSKSMLNEDDADCLRVLLESEDGTGTFVKAVSNMEEIKGLVE